jgi:hypothetical protein
VYFGTTIDVESLEYSCYLAVLITHHKTKLT